MGLQKKKKKGEEEGSPSEEEEVKVVVEPPPQTVVVHLRVTSYEDNDDSEDPLELAQVVLILWSQLCDERSTLRNSSVTSTLIDERMSKFVLHIEQPLEDNEPQKETALEHPHPLQVLPDNADDGVETEQNNVEVPASVSIVSFRQQVVGFGGVSSAAELWEILAALAPRKTSALAACAVDRWIATAAQSIRAHPHGRLSLISLARVLSSRPWCSMLTPKQRHELRVLIVHLVAAPVCAGLAREVFNTMSPITDPQSVGNLLCNTVQAASGRHTSFSRFSHARTVALLQRRVRNCRNTPQKGSCARCGTPSQPKLYRKCTECGHRNADAVTFGKALTPALRFGDWLALLSTHPWCNLLPDSICQENSAITARRDWQSAGQSELTLGDVRRIFTDVNTEMGYSEEAAFMVFVHVIADAHSDSAVGIVAFRPLGRLKAIIRKMLKQDSTTPLFTRFINVLNARPWRPLLSVMLQAQVREFCQRQKGRTPMVMVAQEVTVPTGTQMLVVNIHNHHRTY